jgi:predicted DNA-binding transcriptional regulator
MNSGFIKVPHSIFADARLTYKGQLVYIHLISKIKGWKWYVQNIANELRVSKGFVQQGCSELEKAGYLKRQKVFDTGKFLGYKWIIKNPEFIEEIKPPEIEKVYYSTSEMVEGDVNDTEIVQPKSLADENTAAEDRAAEDRAAEDRAAEDRDSPNQASRKHSRISKNNTNKNIVKRLNKQDYKNGENEIFAFLNENLDNLRKEAKEVFDEYYEFNFRSKFIWDGKQHKNLEGLMKKLTEEAHNAGSELTNEKLINYLGTFLNRLPNLSDGFYYNNHYSPAGLNSNYQKILNHAKSRKKSKGHTFSEEGLMRNYAKWKERERMEMERARAERLRIEDTDTN